MEKECNMFRMAIAGTFFAAAAAFADGASPASGAVHWTEWDGQSMILMKDVPDGKPAWTADLARQAWTFRPTPSGNLLGWDPKGIFEIDRGGRVVWELPAERVVTGDLTRIETADPLPNGNLLVAAASRSTAPGARSWMNAGFVAVEIDRAGRTLRRIAAPVPATFIRAGGADSILWILENRVIETDWSGKELSVVALEAGSRCGDAVKLPSGNFLVVADTTALERAKGETGKAGKTGVAAEVAPDGTVVWRADHDCPRSVQPLPGGNILVGAG